MAARPVHIDTPEQKLTMLRLDEYSKAALVRYLAHHTPLGVVYSFMDACSSYELGLELMKLIGKKNKLCALMTPSVVRRIEQGRPTKRDRDIYRKAELAINRGERLRKELEQRRIHARAN